MPVIGELELSWRLLPNRFCAVTGTNGKTTVAELLGHVWRTAGQPVAVAGNVGTPLASLVGEMRPEATVICEASSFQLEDADAFAPECGVLLNVATGPPRSPPHARRLPGGEAAHVRQPGRRRRLRLQRLRPRGASRGVALGRPRGASSTSASAELGRDSNSRCPAPTTPPTPPPPRPPPRRLGIGEHAIAAGLASFGGVPHRLERVAEIGGVLYVNDSKATNVAAAIAALRSFDGGVRAILGGSLKGGGFEELAPVVAERASGAYLIGEAAERLERDLAAGLGGRGRAPPMRRSRRRPCAAAAADARAGEVVLLAPACASFDQLSRLRGARRALPGPGRGAGSMSGSAQVIAADRVLAAAHRDALPARVRRRHGVQRELDHVAARRVRRRRLLPQAHPDLRRARARWSCTCWPGAG